VACWRTKAAISLERVKIRELLLWTAYRNSPTLFQMVPSPTPMASLPRNWGFATELPPLISGAGKATDFKFDGYIYKANPNKSPLKILEKMERERIQGLSKFFGYPLLSQKRVKLRTSNFVGTFMGSIEQKPMKMLGIVAVGVVRESRKFSGHPCIGRIGPSSLR